MVCKHNEVDFRDDDERGKCVNCGATCDWHYEKDEGNVEDYYWSENIRVIDQWYE